MGDPVPHHRYLDAQPHIDQSSDEPSGLVGVPGFEPGTPCTPCRCATGLRYTPTEPSMGGDALWLTHRHNTRHAVAVQSTLPKLPPRPDERVRVRVLHDWAVTPREAVQMQRKLAGDVVRVFAASRRLVSRRLEAEHVMETSRSCKN